MDEDILPTDEEAQPPPPNKEQPESSHTQELDYDSSCPNALKKHDNILPFIERQLATMDSLNKNSTKRADLLKALNRVIETLKVVHEVVKDDPPLNRKAIEATKAYTKNSTSLHELLTLIKTFDFQGLKSSVVSL
ncbi:hypothetical protein Tco_1099782 [Tanacetum coccineum]